MQLCPAGDAKLKTHRIVTFRVRNLLVTSANVWESGELRICNIWERIVIEVTTVPDEPGRHLPPKAKGKADGMKSDR